MNFWSPKTLRSLVLPGGIFLLAASVVFRGAFGTIPAAAVMFSFYAVFAAGIVLAWRFHSSRILFALATLFLGHRALEFFSSGRIASAGPGRIALEAVAFLLPLNFVAFSVFRERGLVFRPFLPGWRCCSSSRFSSPSSAVLEKPSPPGFCIPGFRALFRDGPPYPGRTGLAAAFGPAGALPALTPTHGERPALGAGGGVSFLSGWGGGTGGNRLRGDRRADSD